MPKPLRYTVRAAPFDRVFGQADALVCAAARAAVLFQDLRLESSLMHAATLASDTSVLHADEIGKAYRQLYGLRRGIATLHEFVGLVLKDLPESQINPRLGPVAVRWKVARAFFKDNQRRIGDLRNDFGGHLQKGAVKAALGMAGSDTTQAVFELVRDDDGLEVPRLKFAHEVAARVFLRRASPKGDRVAASTAYFDEVWDLFSVGVRHASTCTYCLTQVLLLPRFESR